MWPFNKLSDDILDGDQATTVRDSIAWNESRTQLAFAKIIVVGVCLIFLSLTICGVVFIFNGENAKLETLISFTTRWFSPVWAVVGGVVTYFFPSKR